MSSPLPFTPSFASAAPALDWQTDGTVSLKSPTVLPTAEFAPAPLAKVLADFKYTGEDRDRKPLDYLLLGVLSIILHTGFVRHFDGAALEQEIVDPVRPVPKVRITLARPQPKPVAPPPPVAKPKPPVAQPKPPVKKAVPLKPQKPRPAPKVVEPAPAPQPAPVMANAPPAPVQAPPAPPAPVVQEKITAPTAGADYLHNPPPEYPEIAMERGLEGKVLMKVHVLPNGKPDSITVVKSSGQKVLDDAAVKTVRRWSFVPAKRGDAPIAGWVTVPITFNLS
ncbi:energy transducer TonB [Methylomicrobium sp. RS1]|uniref:energy transducer TonB n=1 Tax=Candidatus Methylomicrobium oryzae TaxID=2802053 RepID=UPI0019236F4A|nr:energy transducer TonB [Methylomicrobium sp. RS1]MBL1266022.1 energy transducer TonB [Methylomicrobium sp. RS1]